MAEPSDPEKYRPPPYQLATWVVIGFAFLGVVAGISVRLKEQPDRGRAYPSRPLIPGAEPVLLPPPEMDEEYFPCSDCHEGEKPNPQVRELEDEHDTLELKHGDLWCLHCHDLVDRDKLHLADGQRIAFEDSWRLCTQCHGKKLAEWRAGVHGKRTGHWRGTSEYRTCVTCHDPHSPHFKPLEPKPAPLRPTQITVRGNAVEEVVHEEP